MSSWTDLLVLLGPTASGKTAVAARLAYEIGGEVISADSRQVYRGMDIGTGKDLDDYIVNGIPVPYHLIDIADPGEEYNIYQYQRDFLEVYQDILRRKKTPVLCGGSGMYLEAVLKGYRLSAASDDEEFQLSLNGKSDEELEVILRSFKTLHNKTDLEDRSRLMKAILIARADEFRKKSMEQPVRSDFPEIASRVFGISYPRDLQMQRIAERLEQRLNNGMIDEVERLLQQGVPAERMIKLGLEYKYVTLFLEGKLSRSDLFEKLNIAIRQFAKRQMTWFRRMERQGTSIRWVDGRLAMEEKVATIRVMTGLQNPAG